MKSSNSEFADAPMPVHREQAEGGLLEFDLMALVAMLRRRLNVIVGIVVTITMLVMLVVFQMTPQYTATTQLLLNNQNKNVVDIEAVMSGLPADSATVDSQVQVILSRSVAQRVIEKLNLLNDPEFNPEAGRTGLDAIVAGAKGWVKGLVGAGGVERTEEEQRAALMAAAVNAFIAREDVKRVGLTYLMNVSFTSSDPAKAARIANAIADTYILDQLEAKFDATKQASEWLSSRLDGLRRQLEDSEKAVEIYRSQNDLVGAGGATVSEQQLSELNAQLILARADRAEKQAKYERARSARGSGLEAVTDVQQSATISQLRQQEAQLARKQAEMSSRYGPRHPSIVNIDAERRDLGRQIGAEVARIVASIQNDAAIADTRVAALEQSLKELQEQTGVGNQAYVRLRELEREATANRAVYESFLNRFKETSQQEGLQTSDARVISQASVPLSPSAPKKALILLLTLFVSGLIGVGVALILERLDNGFRTSGQLERIAGLPHLATLPIVPKDDKIGAQDYILTKPLSSFAEGLRSLRTALSLSDVDSPPKLILFTSALPGEGKSTSVVSFARAAAQAGTKVIVLDCDLRRPSIAKLFGAEKPKEGLVEYLAGRVSLDEVIQKDTKSALDFLPIAAGAANPSDILGSMQMQRLLQTLRNTYDLVVIDSAPVLPVVDSRVIGRQVDKTVFVVRWAETPRDAVMNGLKELQSFNIDIAGLIMTQVDTAQQAKYGYGDSGYYYSRYSRYYVN